MGPGPDEVNEVEELRQEIDESRENLGAAVGALAYKADVKNRGKEAISDKKEELMEKVKSKVPGVGGGSDSPGNEGGGISEKVKSKLPSGDQVSGKVDDLKSKLPGGGEGGEGEGGGMGEKVKSVGGAAPSKEELKGKAQGAAETARDNPAVVAAGAVAAGLAAGLALPQTDAEREKLAPKAQQLREDAETRVKEKVDQAKAAVNVAEQAKSLAQTAAGAVREKGEQQEGSLGDVLEKAADRADEKIDKQGT